MAGSHLAWLALALGVSATACGPERPRDEYDLMRRVLYAVPTNPENRNATCVLRSWRDHPGFVRPPEVSWRDRTAQMDEDFMIDTRWLRDGHRLVTKAQLDECKHWFYAGLLAWSEREAWVLLEADSGRSWGYNVVGRLVREESRWEWDFGNSTDEYEVQRPE